MSGPGFLYGSGRAMDREPGIPESEDSGIVDTMIGVMHRLAGLCMMGLMGLVFVSVIFRYFLNDPITAVEDIMSVLLGLAIFAAFPFVTMERSHIRVDLLVPLFKRSKALNRIRLIVIDLGILAMVAFIGKRIFDQAVRHYERESATLAADLPLWPFSTAFAVLVALGFLAFAFVVLRNWRRGKFGDENAS